MNILYVAPDTPVPHTGVGGSTHVLKIARSLAEKKTRFIKKNKRAEEK